MSDVRMEAARRAVALLKASQLEYSVKMPDGTYEGTLKIQVDAPEKPRVRRVKVHNFDRDLQYVKVVKTLGVGESYSWELGVDNQLAFQKVLSSTAGRYIGPGKYITGYKDGKVEILRVE